MINDVRDRKRLCEKNDVAFLCLRDLGELIARGLSDVRRQCGHVDQTRHILVLSGLGDDGSSIGMADEDARSIAPPKVRLAAATSLSNEVSGFCTIATW